MHLTPSCWVLTAFLATAPVVARADASERQARAHFKRAETAFRDGKYEDALTAYQAAYDARALPGLLFNIAQCQRQLGNHERAIFFYERYLELAPGTPNRDRTLGLITEQQAYLAEKRVIPDPPAAAPPPPAPAPAAIVDLGITVPAAPEQPPHLPMAVRSPDRARTGVTSPDQTPLYKRWWFWTAAGAVVASGVSAALLVKRDGPLPEGRLGSIDRR